MYGEVNRSIKQGFFDFFHEQALAAYVEGERVTPSFAIGMLR